MLFYVNPSTTQLGSTPEHWSWLQMLSTMCAQDIHSYSDHVADRFIVDRPGWIYCCIRCIQGPCHTPLCSPLAFDTKHQISDRDDAPKVLSFGWQRATLLGAFFNGVFLLGLGLSIFLQSIERFVSIERTHKVATTPLSRLILRSSCPESWTRLDHRLCWSDAQHAQRRHP